MGLFSGGADLPKFENTGYIDAKTALSKYTQPISGVTQGGSLMQKMAEQRALAAKDRAMADNAGSLATQMSAASMFGSDAGSRERAGQRAAQALDQTNADINATADQRVGDIGANDIMSQQDRAFSTANNLANLGMQNDANKQRYETAKYGAQQKAAAGRSKLFSGLAGIAGTAIGGPLGGAIGSTLGGLF